MRKLVMALFALTALALAQKPAAKSNPPDGHWWLNATRGERNGFLTGYFDCHSFVLRKEVLSGPPGDGLVDAVSKAYDKDDESTAVASVIRALLERWRREGRYRIIRADPSNEPEGSDLWPLFREMPGIVEGFLACQVANGQHPPPVPVRILTARVYKWYGLDIKKYPDTDLGPHANDKLGTVILRAEKGPVRPDPAGRHR